VRLTEAHIHCAVRNYLKGSGWTLVAGQFPGGSDDECHVLNVMDPDLSGDSCPDPSRHSQNKIVPDLFASKAGVLLVVEMKPRYSAADYEKLRSLLSTRRPHLLLALSTFGVDRRLEHLENPEGLTIIPALGFGASSQFSQDPAFCYFIVTSLDVVTVIPPSTADTSHTRILFG